MRTLTTLTAAAALAAAAAGAAAAPTLVITEVLGNSGAIEDFWELTNTGPVGINLENFYWDDGDGFNLNGALFPNLTIAAGQSILIYDDADATSLINEFSLGGVTILTTADMGGSNPFSGLSSGGDHVDLYDASGTLVDTASYGSGSPDVSFEWDGDGNDLGPSVAGENGAYSGANNAIASPGYALVPEPASLALLGLGGLAIARRRRD